MPVPPESKPVIVSQRIYGRLLLVYPKPHRREYGAPMAQLFRDQCRDAWRAARSWGLAGVWFRVLPDLVKTSFLEHLAAMKRRKSMADKISEVTNVNIAPLRTFFTVFIVVFLLVFGLSAAVTFLLPESFKSTARIKIDRGSSDIEGLTKPNDVSGYDPYFIQTEFEVIQSELILRQVAEQLDLNTIWGKKYAGGQKLKTPETIMLLKGRMDLRLVRNTSLIAISVYSEDANEAALLANRIAQVYKDHRLAKGRQLMAGGIAALKVQFDEQEQKVRDAQDEVSRLRKELNISELDAMAPTLEVDAARRLQEQLVTSEAQLDKEETQFKALQKLTSEQRRDVLQTVVGTDDTFSKLMNEQNSAEQKLISLRSDFAPEHPTYHVAKLVADDAVKRVLARMDGVMLGLSTRVNTLRSTVDNLKSKLEKARQMDIEKSESSRPYFEAKRRLEELARFQSLLNLKMASGKVDLSLPKSTMVEIIDVARPAYSPIRPNKALNLFVGAVVGTLLGALAGGAAAWGRGRGRSKTPSHAAAA